MNLRAAVGIFFACIAGESRGFVALPKVATAIVASQQQRTATTSTGHVPPAVSPLMMGKKGGSKKKKRRQLGPFRDAVEKEKDGDARDVAVGQVDEDERSVPRLVVMDLDYTLW